MCFIVLVWAGRWIREFITLVMNFTSVKPSELFFAHAIDCPSRRASGAMCDLHQSLLVNIAKWYGAVRLTCVFCFNHYTVERLVSLAVEAGDEVTYSAAAFSPHVRC